MPDAENVQSAIIAGPSAKLTLKIGGKLPMSPAEPLEVEVSVVSIHDGFFTETKPRHGGKIGGNMGPCAVVKTADNLTVLLMTLRIGVSASAQPLLACGLKPEDYDVIIIKGVHAPVGGYAEVCPTLIRVNTPGVTSADMTTLPYRNRRRPLFPFE